MTLSAILGTATTGLYAAQTGINAVSDNVANVNTAGYVRKIVNQTTSAQDGVGLGVSVASVSRAVNQYLQNASLSAAAQVGQTGALSNLLGQAQALFGDPSSDTSFFSSLNTVFGDFTTAANDPANALNSTQAVNDLTQFLNQAQGISARLSQLGGQADNQIASDVAQANQLLGQIAQLNVSITQATAMGSDATDAQNAQSNLINQLSSLMDVKVAATATGAVTLSTTSGVNLIGQGGAATLGYAPSGANSQVTITQPGVNQTPSNLALASGEMQGLLDLRNNRLPGVQDQLGQFVSGAVYAINAAHNASTAVPPPAALTGQATGIDLPTAIAGFSGTTNVAVVDASGDMVQQVRIDFSAGTMSANGGPATAFTPANFLASLNTALGGTGTASFTNGALSIAATTPGDGVATVDDATTPSSRNGEGFSQYFGLNNLINASTVTNYQTGLAATDPSGFPAGQTLTLRIADGSGAQITDVQVTTPGGDVQSLIDILNQPVGGVGLYGQFSLDSAGALTFTPNKPGGASISVVSDDTQSLSGGVSVSQLFGIGAAQRAARVGAFSVRADIQANPSLLSLATLNLTAAAGGLPALSAGDGSGGLRLAAASLSTVAFGAAGDMAAINTTVSRYAALFGGQLGNDAAAATTANSNAQAVQTEADTRRSSVEGVNLDQELVNLTTYQQAYSASARLISAAQNMFSTLMSMVGP
jgi:flagellar hook-associated protein 1 FlgK